MNYNDKIRYIRNKLGVSQRELGELIGVGQSYINNLENDKTSSRRLSREKEATLILKAGLPPRFFDEEDVEAIMYDNESIVAAMIPEMKDAELSVDDIRAMLKPLAKRRLIEKSSD